MWYHIYKLLVSIYYWGTEPIDAILLESFNMTLERALDVTQQIDSRGIVGCFVLVPGDVDLHEFILYRGEKWSSGYVIS